MTDFDRLLTPKRAAEILGVSPRTLLRWHREGIIEAYRLPTRGMRYPEKEVERLLRKMKREGMDSLIGKL